MKKRISYALSMLCSACFCLSAHAQEGQNRPGLPPVSTQKVEPVKVEVNLPPTPVQALNGPCGGAGVDPGTRTYTGGQESPEVGKKTRGPPPIEPMPGTGG